MAYLRRSGGGRGPVWRGGTTLLLALGLQGCTTMLEPLVGRDTRDGGTPHPTMGMTPELPAAAIAADAESPFAGPSFVGPTLAMDTAPADQPVPDRNPHRVIASAPLSAESAVVAPLGEAVRKLGGSPDARYVLLVLTPPATDIAAFDSTATRARGAAAAAMEAIAGAGVPRDHVEVSMATNAEVGDGELRLYRR